MVTLVEGKGLLVHANYSIGICCYKDKNYAFRSKRASIKFQHNPEKYVTTSE